MIRNDEITVDEIEAMKPELIVLSPDPGKTGGAGVCEEVVRKLVEEKYRCLGVCLGHQAICEAFGAKIVTYAKELMHGKTSKPFRTRKAALFRGMGEATYR